MEKLLAALLGQRNTCWPLRPARVRTSSRAPHDGGWTPPRGRDGHISCGNIIQQPVCLGSRRYFCCGASRRCHSCKFQPSVRPRSQRHTEHRREDGRHPHLQLRSGISDVATVSMVILTILPWVWSGGLSVAAESLMA